LVENFVNPAGLPEYSSVHPWLMHPFFLIGVFVERREHLIWSKKRPSQATAAEIPQVLKWHLF
jgi:hypothetical protein